MKTNILKNDSLIKTTKDSTDVSTQKKSKPNQIDAEIIYSAKDSIVFYGNGTGFLHGDGDIKYKTIKLKADFVRVKMDSSLVFAHGKTDSIGKKIGEPVFNEGETEYNSKELTYNLKTKKGFIRQAVTKQGEGFIISDKTKKTAEDILCIERAKYTTCDDKENPHFYLSLSKGKVKPGKYVVSGPAHLVICDVPLPLAIPFGFFPFTDQYSSGVLMPTYADELNRGFGLINGGYYFAINDKVDLEFRGDIYTKGTWSLAAISSYHKRYKYSGNFNFNYREDVIGEKGMSDYSKRNNMSIRWSHSQDQKANPYFNFSASVNYSTSGYNQSNINNYARPEILSESTTASSVNFTKRFPESPFNISGSMNFSQQKRDSTIDLGLPNINISMSRIYPLKRKNAVGKERWYEKISLSYSGTLENRIRTKENLLLGSSLTRDWKNGMRHSIPVSATFNLLKYINISPSFNYNERWYLQSINRSYDKDNQKVITDTTTGFKRVYDFDMGVSASTKIYATYTPDSSIFGNKINRIRHVMTPNISFSYRPNFGEHKWGYYDNYTELIRDATNPTIYHSKDVQYSHYEGSLYGAPGVGKSGSIGFSLSNNVEMKVRNDNDTTGLNKFKTVSIIDNLSIGGGYNLAADSMQWSTFNVGLHLKFGKSYRLDLSGGFDPYMYGLDKSGNAVHINKLRWENGKFPRFLGTNTSFSYTLSNETFKKKTKDKKGTKNNSENNDQSGTVPNNTKNPKANETENGDAKMDADGYQKVTIPWSIRMDYSVTYANTDFNKSKMEYNMGLTHNLSLSGSLTLTTNWNFTTSTTYNFKTNKIDYTSINVTRKLHCWTMTGSFVPFGPYKTYNFHIGANASMLQDLKYDKRSESRGNSITWY